MPEEGEQLYVDTSLALETLEQLRTLLKQIDGTPIPPAAHGRSRVSILAQITKDLSFGNHLAMRLGVEIMNEYYVVRGRTELA